MSISTLFLMGPRYHPTTKTSTSQVLSLSRHLIIISFSKKELRKSMGRTTRSSPLLSESSGAGLRRISGLWWKSMRLRIMSWSTSMIISLRRNCRLEKLCKWWENIPKKSIMWLLWTPAMSISCPKCKPFPKFAPSCSSSFKNLKTSTLWKTSSLSLTRSHNISRSSSACL